MIAFADDPSVHFNKSRSDDEEEYGYEIHTRTREGNYYYNHNRGLRIFSTRRNNQNLSLMTSSLSYRRERARKRLVFLQTYKLRSANSRKKLVAGNGKLNKIVVRVKAAFVSVLGFIRGGALRSSCNSRSAIKALRPQKVAVNFC